MIVHAGKGKWLLLDRAGKRLLGMHKSAADARAQETAINLSKIRRRRSRD
jgi:hypothetical protein